MRAREYKKKKSIQSKGPKVGPLQCSVHMLSGRFVFMFTMVRVYRLRKKKDLGFEQVKVDMGWPKKFTKHLTEKYWPIQYRHKTSKTFPRKMALNSLHREICPNRAQGNWLHLVWGGTGAPCLSREPGQRPL